MLVLQDALVGGGPDLGRGHLLGKAIHDQQKQVYAGCAHLEEVLQASYIPKFESVPFRSAFHMRNGVACRRIGSSLEGAPGFF